MIIRAQAFRFCTCLDKSKNMDSGRIKIIGWIAIFLLPKVEAGAEFCAKLKGSSKILQDANNGYNTSCNNQSP